MMLSVSQMQQELCAAVGEHMGWQREQPVAEIAQAAVWAGLKKLTVSSTEGHNACRGSR